jgi:CPA2 family monovalent cation:H+ antiporter-2
MHDLDLILTLTSGMAAALAMGFVTHKLGLSPIVGYLLAGILVGSHTPGLEVDHKMAEQVAHIGVILLMFGVGLQFHLHELLAVRRIAIPGAIVQIAAATALGALVGWFAWHSLVAGIVFGLCISVASTVVLLRVLSDNNALHTSTGHTAVGWLVVEDLFTVVALVLLPALFGQAAGAEQAPDAVGAARDASAAADHALGWTVMQALGWALLKIGAFVAIVFVVGGRIIPWILKKIAASNSRELFTLAVLVIALGIAVGSNVWFDVSMELGAFLAGMIVARSQFSFRAASEALPMRDAFAVLFFVSVGMLLDPFEAIQSPGLLLATLGIVLVGKPLAAFAIVLLLRYPVRVAIGVSIALAQIGEFSFILAELARTLDVLTDEATNILIAAAIVSISLNPLLYKLAGPLERWMRSMRPDKKTDVDAEDLDTEGQPSPDPRERAVVVGYGPVGQTVTRLLRENDLAPTVIDLNVDTVEKLNQDGARAVYGDATQREILVGAGVAKARTLILSAPKIEGTTEIIRIARELNPAIRVLARTTYLSENEELRKSGADDVFSGEGELALAFTEAVLEDLGATPEQIDRERDRVHEELFVRSQAERH